MSGLIMLVILNEFVILMDLWLVVNINITVSEAVSVFKLRHLVF